MTEYAKDKPRKIVSAKIRDTGPAPFANNTVSPKIARRRGETWEKLKRTTDCELVGVDVRVEAGAEALMAAFPTLLDDFTPEWFRKVARIVLEAAE